MQQIDPSLSYRLVYSLGEHPYLGYVIEPHIVQLNANGTLSLSFKRIFSNTADEFAKAISPEDAQIIKILDEIEQTHIIKRYHKKAIRPADYFSKIFDQKIYDYIRPKIEQKLVKVLHLLKGKPLYRMNPKDGYPAHQKLDIASEPASILFHFRRNDTETRYFPTIKYGDERLNFMYRDAEVVIQSQAWLLLENTLYYFEDNVDGKKISPFLQKRYIAVPKSTEKKYFQTFVAPLIEKFSVYAEGFDIKTIKEEATPVITFQTHNELQASVFLNFRYGEYMFSPASENRVTVRLSHDEEQDSYTFFRIKRSLQWEEKQHNLLIGLGLELQEKNFGRYMVPNDQEQQISATLEWLNKSYEALTSGGFEIETKTGEKRYFVGRVDMEMELEEQHDWFDLKAVVQFGSFQIPFIKLRQHILQRNREYVLPNGEIAVIPEEWFAKYESLFQFSTKKDELHFHKMHIGLLHEISEHTTLTLGRKLEKLSEFEQIEQTDLPKNFNGQLRPYQQAGYNWLCFLQQYHFGGILADDMGLGKTIQTLALLQKQREDHQAPHPYTSLLILPTSLVYNWQQEASKFAPKLRICLHIGTNRIKDPIGFTSYDLVITTYGVARSDEELLQQCYFNYIILDEAQNIKNSASKSFKAIKSIKSRFKLALSGTPIENSVADIWSQLHFANPGLLGSHGYFQKEFVLPIEKKKDEDKAQRLLALIKPFVLRRTKDQVATELPPKMEQIIYCEMSEAQHKMYEKTKSEYRNLLLDEALADPSSASLTLLQGLTKLRLLANHPIMADEEYTRDSGKFDAVIEMLEAVCSEGHKVLIFSQFVRHLAVFQRHFEKNGTRYAYLDGATKDRQFAVDLFKQGNQVNIFLISIKAGGVGLNLTEADYVFILDPWWNPAVEQQAIDRSHRIGQKRNVFIYRFISKDTVEEKIVALQRKKQRLASTLVTTEESFVKSLTPEDVRKLLD